MSLSGSELSAVVVIQRVSHVSRDVYMHSKLSRFRSSQAMAEKGQANNTCVVLNVIVQSSP